MGVRASTQRSRAPPVHTAAQLPGARAGKAARGRLPPRVHVRPARREARSAPRRAVGRAGGGRASGSEQGIDRQLDSGGAGRGRGRATGGRAQAELRRRGSPTIVCSRRAGRVGPPACRSSDACGEKQSSSSVREEADSAGRRQGEVPVRSRDVQGRWVKDPASSSSRRLLRLHDGLARSLVSGRRAAPARTAMVARPWTWLQELRWLARLLRSLSTPTSPLPPRSAR
jgi:hypothetical protein